MDILDELQQAVGALDEAGVPYALAGAWALAVHGAPRATTDIDLLVQPTDLERAVAAVATVGFRHKAMPMRFPDGMEIQRLTKIEADHALTLDLLLAGEPLQAIWASRSHFEALGFSLCVISRDALIQMKVWAGRPQDLADVARLEGDDR